MLRFHKTCPFCRVEHSYALDVSMDQFMEWSTNRDALIQNVMPDLPIDEREVLITGMCFDCQSQVFQ